MSELRPQETPDAEAAAWFARLGAHTVSADTLEAFRRWRRDPSNARAYKRVESAWNTAGGLSKDADIRAATARAVGRPRRRGWQSGLVRARLPLIAMGGAGLAVVGAVAYLTIRPAGYATGVGEQRLVVLNDGSRVRLNTDSALLVRYTPGERRLTLTRGEAFFEAAHDPARPFLVDAGLARVRAIGTRFDVRRLDGAVGVTLLQGRVSVRRDGDATWTLAPNQRLVVPAAGAAAPVSADPDTAAAWTTGRISFHATPLQDAVAEVNRYSKRKIALGEGVSGGAPVSGVFDVGDTDGFVSALSGLFGFEAEKTGAGILLKPAAKRG